MAVDVKICGITTVDDARMALDCGADLLGFVLHAASPRGITPGRLLKIRGAIDTAARCVAVVVNAEPAVMAGVAADNALVAVQVCGEEEAAAWAGLAVPIWRALRRDAEAWLPAAPEDWPAARYVVDAHVPGQYGGTGQTADWESAAVLAAQVPVMLAGGLTPENVAEGFRKVRPAGVDVASGVEAAPGRKDHRKVRQFMAALRAAAAS